MLSLVSILWCTHAASSIFVAVLRMSDQRFLVAYPVGLLYGCFALFRCVVEAVDHSAERLNDCVFSSPLHASVFTVGVPGAK